MRFSWLVPALISAILHCAGVALAVRCANTFARSAAGSGEGVVWLEPLPSEPVADVAEPQPSGVAWVQPEPAPIVETAADSLPEPAIDVPRGDAIPFAEPHSPEPVAAAAPAFAPPGGGDSTSLSPYWESVRSDIAGRIRWPASWGANVSIDVSLVAEANGLVALEPVPGGDAARRAVRRAVERSVRSSGPPPAGEVGRSMSFRVRFELENHKESE